MNRPVSNAIIMARTKDTYNMGKTPGFVPVVLYIDDEDVERANQVCRDSSDPRHQKILTAAHERNIHEPLTEKMYHSYIAKFEKLLERLQEHTQHYPKSELVGKENEVNEWAKKHRQKKCQKIGIHLPLLYYRQTIKLVNEVIDREIRMAQEENQLCGICGVKTTKHCTKCKNIYYCSSECQRNDWKVHKELCYSTSGPW